MEPRWKKLIPELVDRHQVIDLSRFTWFKRPAIVKIALYAEGSIKFDGGGFDGLQRVIAALNSDPWPWVKFETTLIHRGSDPTADMQNIILSSVDLEQYDELWLFGIASGNLLSPAEINAVNSFMDGGGGVLHTGDHASLGQGISGAIQRAGEMRQYPAPNASSPVWNSTLRSGADAFYSFGDQSDDYPQGIRLKYYYQWGYQPSLVLKKYPHPVMCGTDGPIRIFPDHQHEGEAIAPASYPSATWPAKNGYQPKVEVVAFGRIEDPSADVGREVGLVSTYDGHRADVGRIIADSTWHHWFDINLDGFALSNLDKIEQYFLNVAAWLAPKYKQSQMRNGVTIFASWRSPLVELDVAVLQPWILGGIARDALGQYAPNCMVRQWLIDLISPRLERELDIFKPDLGPEQLLGMPFPIEDVILASALSPILKRNQDLKSPEEAIDMKFVDNAFIEAVPAAAKVVARQSKRMRQVEKVVELMQSDKVSQ